MNKALGIALLVLAAVAVLAVGSYLVGGVGPLGSSGGGAEEDPDGIAIGNGSSADPASGAAGRPRSPVLFGRASERVGKGDVLGRAVDFATKEPVVGATVRIEGTGFGLEQVAVSVDSGPDGRFHFTGVPAGEDYVLEVVVDEAVSRRVTALTVPADDVADLGTIWLGDAGTLLGRVVSIEGGGIAGATVLVLTGGFSVEQMMQDIVGFISKLDRDPEPLARGTTDANGRFEIEGVPPGPITIIARASGFYQQIRQAAMTKDGVIGDEPVFLLEVAEIITGRVISDVGRGVAGARIAFMDTRDEENGFYGRRFVETDGDGTFRVESPPPEGQLLAIVAADGFPTLFSEVGDRREGLEFTLVGGALLTLRFVQDDTGEPISEASIVAMLSEDAQMGNKGSFLSGVTDALGEVELQARPGVVVMLFFRHPRLGASMYSPQMGMALGGAMLKGPEKLEVVAGESRAELRKVPGVRITGRVTNASGEPVPGATVQIGANLGMLGGGGKVVTNESGTYTLTVAAMPQTSVAVEAPGYVQDPSTMLVKIDPAGPVEHDIQLLTAARVEGRVVGPRGEPGRGVQVTLMVEKDNARDDVFGNLGRAATSGITDNDGRYVFETVVPGRSYHVVGSGDGYIPSRSEPFEVRESATITKASRLTMQTGLRVEVEVLDPSGGAVKGAKVDVHVEPLESVEQGGFGRWRAFQKLVTDARGRATAKDVPPGKVTFTASARGFASSRGSTAVTRAAPPTRPVAVRLRSTTVVAGEVRDQHGDAVPGARVTANGVGSSSTLQSATDQDWVPSSSDTADAQGRFELEGMPAGARIQLWIHAEGYTGKTFPIDGPTDALRLQIQKVDPDLQRRMNEIQTELMAIYQRLQAAKDDAERQELQKQISALSTEMNRLQQGGVDHAEARAEEDGE